MGFAKIRKGACNQELNFPENCRVISNFRMGFWKIRKATVRQILFVDFTRSKITLTQINK